MKSELDRSFLERVGHAVSFEAIAVIVCAPVLAWVMGKPLAQMGALTLMFSMVAMVWNMVFNMMFDRAQRRLGFQRGLWVRLAHASLFELGLIFMLVPLAAWWLSVSLMTAFWLDIGLILFFLPYTMAFNWTYDVLRARYMRRRMDRAECSSG
jgi:uncharacterized membrane protein